MQIGDHIKNVLIAFGDPHVDRVEIPVEGKPKTFRNRFYKAMRICGFYWLLSVEGDKLHVKRIRGTKE